MKLIVTKKDILIPAGTILPDSGVQQGQMFDKALFAYPVPIYSNEKRGVALTVFDDTGEHDFDEYFQVQEIL